MVCYCIVLYCPVLHYSTLQPGINPFAVNNNNNNNNNNNIEHPKTAVPKVCPRTVPTESVDTFL